MAQVGKAAITALAALLVVDVGLVALAVRHVQGTDLSAETTPAPSETGKSNGGDSPGEKPKDPQPAEVPETLVNLGADGAVGRAVVGACGDGGGKVELSTDSGDSWTTLNLPEAEVVVRISVLDADQATVAGADASCETITTYTTTNGGGQWSEVEAPEIWHVSPEPSASVYSPAGEVDVPCAEGETVADVSMFDSSTAYALCSDGVIQETTDGGGTWEQPGDVPGATGVDFFDSSIGLAVVPGADGCEGVSVMRTEDGGAEWTEASCLQTTDTGKAHLSAKGEEAYVALGESTWSSDDQGSSWSPVGG